MRTWYVVVSSSGVTRPTAHKHPCFALQRKPLARRDLACSSNERGFRRMLCFRFRVVFLCRLFPKVRVLRDTPSDARRRQARGSRPERSSPSRIREPLTELLDNSPPNLFAEQSL